MTNVRRAREDIGSLNRARKCRSLLSVHHAQTTACQDSRLCPVRREAGALHGRAGPDGDARLRKQPQYCLFSHCAIIALSNRPDRFSLSSSPAYFHPVTLAIWIAVSSMFAQYMHWWPNSEYGMLSWLQVLPAFFAPAVPIMFFVDW